MAKEKISYSFPGGARIECSGEDATKLFNGTWKKGLLFCGIALAGGLGAKMVHDVAKPSLEKIGNKLKNFIFERHKTDSGPRVETGAEVRKTKEPKREWIVPGIVKQGDTVVLFAPEKCGKSTFLINLGMSINSGVCDKAFPAYCPIKVPVIYFNMELDRKTLNEWFSANPNYDQFKMVNKKDWTSLEDLFDFIRKQLSKIEGDIVVKIDNLSKCHYDSSYETALKIHKMIDEIKEERLQKGGTTTVVMITHTVKDAKQDVIDKCNMRGSSTLTDLADVTLGLQNTSVENQKVLKVVNIRSGHKNNLCYLIERICEPGNHHFEFVKMVDEAEVLQVQKDKTQTRNQSKTPLEYAKCSKDLKEKLLSFWKEVRQKRPNISDRDLSKMTLEQYNIRVSDESIRTKL